MGPWKRWLSRKVQRIERKRWDWVVHRTDPGEELIEHVGARLHWSDGSQAGVAFVTDRAFLFCEYTTAPGRVMRLKLEEIRGLVGLGDGPRFKLVWDTSSPRIASEFPQGAVVVELYPSPAAINFWGQLTKACMQANPDWEELTGPT